MRTHEPQKTALRGVSDAPRSVPAAHESTVDAVVLTVLAAAAVAAELRRHSVAAAPKLAARCEQVARALDAALAAEFGDVLKSDDRVPFSPSV